MNSLFLDASYYFLNFRLHTHIFYPHTVDKHRNSFAFSLSLRLFKKITSQASPKSCSQKARLFTH